MSVSTQRINKLLQKSELTPLLDTTLPRGSRVYLVGGFVRDFLLRRKSIDIDVAVDGDFNRIIERYRKKIPGRVIKYPAFHTASIESDKLRYDFVRTRKESYPKPSVLPEVDPAGIVEDLKRRDFTINAMAVTLKPKSGKFLDPCEGYNDIKRRKIRALHPESFRDDPTRVFRAYRYARRFTFAIDRKTKKWIRESLSYIEYLSSERIINELKLISQERHWLEIIRYLRNAKILALIFDRKLIRRAKLAPDRYLFLLAHLKTKILESAPIDLPSLKSAKEVKKIEELAGKLKKTKSRSRIYRTLSGLEPTTITLMKGLYPELKKKIRQFRKDQKKDPLITGADLINLGLNPSPQFKKILDRIRSLQIDRKIKSRKEAEEMVRQWISTI